MATEQINPLNTAIKKFIVVDQNLFLHTYPRTDAGFSHGMFQRQPEVGVASRLIYLVWRGLVPVSCGVSSWWRIYVTLPRGGEAPFIEARTLQSQSRQQVLRLPRCIHFATMTHPGPQESGESISISHLFTTSYWLVALYNENRDIDCFRAKSRIYAHPDDALQNIHRGDCEGSVPEVWGTRQHGEHLSNTCPVIL